MTQKHTKAIIWGFLFGTIGLFILSALALIFQPIEIIKDWLSLPIRIVAQRLAGSEGSNLEVLLLTVGNGLLYALIFYLVSTFITINRSNSERHPEGENKN